MYNNQFVVHTTFHSGTEYISCPWSYRPDQPLDWDHIIQLAGYYSSVSGYANLEYGQGYNGMYGINGSTKNGNYGMMGSAAWTMEISYSKHPPTSQIMMYYNWNCPSMIAMIEYAGYGLEGTITDAITGDPIAAAVFANDYYPAYSDPTEGDYHKYVLPGTYSITVVANGYQSQTINNVVVTSNSSKITDFQLQPGGGHFVYKFSASQIPDNNFLDEGLTSAVLGSPDDINYSIGKSGWCVLDMQNPILDGAGSDLTVDEGDSSPEGYYCYAGQTIDGPWQLLGTGTGTTQFDLAASGLEEAQYIRILDDGDGTATAANAGFDLDAIETLSVIPVELISFTAQNVRNKVILKWQTATETNNMGFEIERKIINVGDGEWITIGFREGNGTTTEPKEYSYVDDVSDIQASSLSYKLKQIDFDGSIEYSPEIEVDVNGPTEFALYQNYPNPFNPSTTIKFELPKKADLIIAVYNSLGEKVAVAFKGELDEGYHQVEFYATSLPSGVYFYRLESEQFTAVKKMLLIK